MSWDTTLKSRPERPSAPRVPTLRVLFSVDRPVGAAPWTLRPGRTDIGRAAEDGIQLATDPRLSRRHATLDVPTGEGSVRITDTSSTGTFVDGERITEGRLTDGALVRMGDTFLLFRWAPADEEDVPIDGLLGDAPAMRRVRSTLALVGASEATVLLLGDSGTGKEVAARALHEESGRRGAFVAVNCSAIPESLAEAQLFGHVAGAYTGARTDGPGFFRAAEGGTLFLDEIGELPLTMQPKLLRAIEERAVTPVGATQPIPCDIRLVAATNRDVIDAVLRGEFRGDVYARLGEFTIEMPPLRERREDIFTILSTKIGSGDVSMAPELAEALLLHPWPFNVRELVKVAVQLQVRSGHSQRYELEMVEEHLRRTASVRPAPGSSAPPPPGGAPEPSGAPAGATFGGVPTRDELELLLRRHRGVVADVAREAKRSRKQVYRWLEQYELDPNDFRKA